MTTIRIKGHFRNVEENLCFIGLKNRPIKHFESSVTYAIGFNDAWDSTLVLDAPQGWSHPKLIPDAYWDNDVWNFDKSGTEFRTKKSFCQWGMSSAIKEWKQKNDNP